MNRTAIDILKALVLLYGSAWETDLKDALMGLWAVRNMGLMEIGEAESALPKAEKLLVEKGLIKVETRYKSDLGSRKPIEEKFYSTDHLFTLLRIFGGDIELDKLRFQAQQ